MGQVIAGPWGPVEWEPSLPRRNCQTRGCPVLIPFDKPGGLCHGCRLSRPGRPGRKPREVTVDPELGPMRWCGGCEEFWPADGTFWYRERRDGRNVYHCRGCRK